MTNYKIIFFTADWCNACKSMYPILNQLQTKFEVQIVDIEKEKNLAEAFSVKNLPTTIIIKDSQVINRFVGLVKMSELLENLKK
jgi:thioredoxin-like negative regulator of GroEL